MQTIRQTLAKIPLLKKTVHFLRAKFPNSNSVATPTDPFAPIIKALEAKDKQSVIVRPDLKPLHAKLLAFDLRVARTKYQY